MTVRYPRLEQVHCANLTPPSPVRVASLVEHELGVQELLERVHIRHYVKGTSEFHVSFFLCLTKNRLHLQMKATREDKTR